VNASIQRSSSGHPKAERRGRAGFTMIELLVVIAIIAILGAVMFPAAMAMRVKGQQSQLVSNMKAIQASLGIYKADENGYPPTLGPVIIEGNNDNQYGGMYPEWVRDRGTFHSPNLDLDADQFNAPILVEVDTRAVARRAGDHSEPAQLSGSRMFAWNTMDGSIVRNGSDETSAWRYVLHYSRVRTTDRNDPDYKRQLSFRNPPEDTVVTWNDTFVDYTDPDNPRGDLFVLFLNGTVKKYNVRDKGIRDLNGAYWRLKPY
jgi:prepilin-type N-terminal cleavage/methylation domain-containing protein